MILGCNSCGKKFVVPDNAITEAGRLVQCSACGNKWRQFPIKNKGDEQISLKPSTKQKSSKSLTSKKQVILKKTNQFIKKVKKKTREVNLYSPEYLAKKHGINIRDSGTPKISKKVNVKDKVSFGFYSSLFVFLVLVIFFSRTLYFTQSFIVALFPNLEFYLNYFFENIRNLFEIWKNLITNY